MDMGVSLGRERGFARALGWAMPLGTQGPSGPLAVLARRYLRFLPAVGLLGFLASLLEGFGIGLLIPLTATLNGSEMPRAVRGPLKTMTDALSGLDRETQVLAFGGVIILMILIKGLFQITNASLIASIDGRLARDIRDALSSRILRLDFAFFLQNDPTRLIKIISTDSWFVAGTVKSYLAIVPAAIGIAVFSLTLAWLEWRMCSVVLVFAVAVRLVLGRFERQQRRLSFAVTESNYRLADRMLGEVNAMRIIRVFGQQEREQRAFQAASEKVRRSMFVSARLATSIAPLVDVVMLLLFLSLLLTAYLFDRSLPTTLAFLVLLARMQPLAREISQARIAIAGVRGATMEVEWLLDQRELPQLTHARPIESLDRPIRFSNVSYRYPNGTWALRDVDVTLRPGVVTALIGRSGSGKSTIVNLLCRLIHPSRGVVLHGDDPADMFEVGSWRRRIAIAGQDIDLVDGTIAENIAYGRETASSEEIEEAARLAGAHEFILALPHGYTTRAGSEGLNLSGGQRQRIGIARAVLVRPDLLILDEATNAVDALSESEIIALHNDREHFRTALVISHRRRTLAACEDGIVLKNGRLTEAGPLADLEYYARMDEHEE